MRAGRRPLSSTTIIIIIVLLVVLGGGGYGYSALRRPGYTGGGFSPVYGIGGLLVTILFLWLVFHLLLHVV